MGNPKTLGPLLRESFDFFSRRLFDLIKIALVVYLPVSILLTALEFRRAATGGEFTTWAEAGIFAVIYVVAFVAFVLYQIAVLKAVDTAESGRPLSVSSVYREAGSVFFSYLWVVILLTVKIFLWSLLLIVPGIIFSILYSLATMALIVDGHRGNQALVCSKKIIKPSVWKFIGNVLVLSFLVMIAYLLIGLVVTVVFGVPVEGDPQLRPAVGNILLSLMQMAVSLYSTVFFYKLYRELKTKITVPSGSEGTP